MPRPATIADPRQQELPFALLDVQGRSSLTVKEVASRLHCTPRHICDLIDEGELVALNIAGRCASRMTARIPVESYRDFVIRSCTAPLERSPLRHLPTQALVRLYHDLAKHLRNKGIPTHA